MSDFFLLVSASGSPSTEDRAKNLILALKSHAWQSDILLRSQNGKCWLGFVGSGEQVAANCAYQSAAVSCVVVGTISKSDLSGAVSKLNAKRYAEAAVDAYREWGTDLGNKLAGHFTICIVDNKAGRVVTLNSRSAYTPTYEYSASDSITLCSKAGPMARCVVTDPEPDAEAVAQLLAYEQMFRNRTLAKHVEAWGAATSSVISLATAKSDRTVYWNFRENGPIHTRLSMADAQSVLCDAFDAAARRIAKVYDVERLVCGLSGGYDSRLVAGLVARHVDNMKTWTFGSNGAPDLEVASELSTLLGASEHLVYSIEPRDIVSDIEEFVSSVDGSVTANWAFGQSRKRDLRQHADVVLNGFGGDAYLGGSMTGGKFRAVGSWVGDRLRFSFDAPNPFLEYNSGARQLAKFVAFGNKINAHALRDWFAVPLVSLEQLAYEDLTTLNDDIPEWYQVEQWLFEQRCQRQTVMSIVADRPFYADDSLFYDYDVMDSCFAIHPSLRRGHRVYKRVLAAMLPQAAKLRNSNTGLAATTPQSVVTTHKVFSKAWEKMTGRPSSHVADTTGVNAPQWIRTELKEFYGDLVNDSRTRGREFWNGQEIRRMFDAHLRAEDDFSGPLGFIASVEVFLRRWIDTRY